MTVAMEQPQLGESTRPDTKYTVLARTMEKGGSLGEWSELALVKATSTAQARRRAIDTDAGRELVAAVKAKTHRVWTVAVANFGPVELEVVAPEPPPDRIKC